MVKGDRSVTALAKTTRPDAGKQAELRAAAAELNARLRADRSPEDEESGDRPERGRKDASPRQDKRAGSSKPPKRSSR